jgi:cystathionine beta-synthase
MQHESVLTTIGNTPLIKLSRMSNGIIPATVYGKVEAYNPGHSAKDRIALFMIEEAERRGDIKPGDTIIEATSGNTGYSLAMVCAIKGYHCVLTLTFGRRVSCMPRRCRTRRPAFVLLQGRAVGR